MIATLSAVTFAFPAALWALLALPVIWWLLRFTPPKPERVAFPPFRLLLQLTTKEEQPDHTPWWLILLRLLLAALVILAVARPMTGATDLTGGRGVPLLVVVDDGWAAARDWQKRVDFLSGLVDSEQQSGRTMAIATTTPRARYPDLKLMPASDLRRGLSALTPVALEPDRSATLSRLRTAFGALPAPDVVWLSDGIDHRTAATFAQGLQGLAGGLATVTAVTPLPQTLGSALSTVSVDKGGVKVVALRPAAAATGQMTVRALAGNGRSLLEQQLDFAAGALRQETVLNLPLELRNELARIEISGERSAGAVKLIDDRWRRKAVGIATGATLELEQPLLSPLYYVTRALEPFAELREPADESEGIADLIAGGLSMLVLADIGIIPASTRDVISDWVENGGVLLRFAGPRLAGGHDDLVPVELRSGGRELGSALSWEEPQAIAAFDDRSPFSGLAIDPDIRVRRQVLAEPSAELPERIWANLADGTPLITAAPRGKGLVVLIHVTANSDWSNLPLSGLFVDMLRRVLDLAPGIGGGEAGKSASAAASAYAPSRALNGFGEMTDMPPDAQPIPVAQIDKTAPSPRHPAGLYLRAGATRALNVNVSEDAFRALPALPSGIRQLGYGAAAARSLAGQLLAAALVLFLLDTLAAMTLAKAWQRLRFGGAPAALLALLVLSSVHGLPALAQEHLPSHSEDAFAIEATTTTRLAYVMTGDRAVDDVALSGLQGLTAILKQRTAIEPGEPMGIDIERDDIVFFPLLYWPLTPQAPQLSAVALAKIDKYMKNGGTILFDTRDAASAVFSPDGVSPETESLRAILANLDIPPIEPVPESHVLTKSFYLMQSFPGRWNQGRLWVEAQGERNTTTDGVTSIIIGSNDYAAAWAIDTNGAALLPVSPGGEDQREFSYRTGVNVVMYALTGNYKSDQVHVPALLERLGQ
ncbi:MAG TPA: DUF4159 domain-containing protein [Aestuariivirgaceae bacterium]